MSTPDSPWWRGRMGLPLAALSGLLTAGSTPGFHAPLLAFICLVPLLAVVGRDVAPRQAFTRGWLAGTVAFLVSMSWVAETMQTYGGLPPWIAWPVALLLAAYLGLYTGLFAVAVRMCSRYRIALLLAAPVVWVALEYLRTHLLTGLPWNLLGLGLAPFAPLIQIADTTGIYGVSAFVVAVNVSIAALVLPILSGSAGRRQGYYFNHGIALFLIPIAVVGYGQFQMTSLRLTPPRATPTLETAPHLPAKTGLRVALVQPDIAQAQKWLPGNLNASVMRLEQLSRDTAPDRPDLVVWPESALPLVLERDPGYLARVTALATGLDTHLLVGSLSPAPGGAVRNSVYLVGPDGAVLQKASKYHLVPFGEYVPLGPLLSWVSKLTAEVGDVVPGAPHTLLRHPRGNGVLAVCYELIFPDLVRRGFAAGGDFLVTVTNDAWFGTSRAPAQHFANAVFRAVENRTYVVRAANTGISGMVDPFGTVQVATPLNEAMAVVVDIEHRLEETRYSRYGDLFAQGSGIFSLALLALAWRRRNKGGPDRSPGPKP